MPQEHYRHVVAFWPLVGWLTGGTMALTLWGLSHFFPVSVAWTSALVARLLLTGCLHEDGLADFLDGFGGGQTRADVLRIMKDSHIGTYGVVGLTLYFLLAVQIGATLPVTTLCAVCLCADVYGKWTASHLINLLPYARREEESKARVTYRRMSPAEALMGIAFMLIPVVPTLPSPLWLAALFPPLTLLGLVGLMRRRIGGYTGDCCGAAFLLCELTFLAVAAALAT